MTTHAARSKYVAIWVWLLVLMGAGVAASFLPGARALAVTAIFATAVAKALLVALHYMHLKLEPWVIYAIALVPRPRGLRGDPGADAPARLQLPPLSGRTAARSVRGTGR